MTLKLELTEKGRSGIEKLGGEARLEIRRIGSG
jgi:hypothetical protein